MQSLHLIAILILPRGARECKAAQPPTDKKSPFPIGKIGKGVKTAEVNASLHMAHEEGLDGTAYPPRVVAIWSKCGEPQPVTKSQPFVAV